MVRDASRDRGLFQNMNIPLGVLIGVFALVPIGRTQFAFQNLGFESAQVAPTPPGGFGGQVPIDQALPGWAGFLGTQPAVAATYNNVTVGGANIAIFGPNWTTAQIIGGRYTVLLQAGGLSTPGGGGQTVGVSIAQTGLIPVGTSSIRLKASGTDFAVWLGGQNIPMVELSTGPNYVLYGGDVSWLAGQTGELRLSALPLPPHYLFNNVLLDSIVFSAQPVPEPGVLALCGFGSMVFGIGWLRKMLWTDANAAFRFGLCNSFRC